AHITDIKRCLVVADPSTDTFFVFTLGHSLRVWDDHLNQLFESPSLDLDSGPPTIKIDLNESQISVRNNNGNEAFSYILKKTSTAAHAKAETQSIASHMLSGLPELPDAVASVKNDILLGVIIAAGMVPIGMGLAADLVTLSTDKFTYTEYALDAYSKLVIPPTLRFDLRDWKVLNIR
ncbi:MAG: hypothetical protein ACI9BD_000173, partial [Candidatus Marinamargulisbacteria bacterium]